MRAQDLMSHPALTCHVNDPLTVPARLMWDHDCGAIAAVRDDGTLAGMITDRDICMAAFTQDRRLEEILVGVVMAKEVFTIRPDQSIEEAERSMAEHQVRRLPVVDSENRPIGVLSMNDLVIENAQLDTCMLDGPQQLVQTLAAICQPRAPAESPRGAKAPIARSPIPSEEPYLR